MYRKFNAADKNGALQEALQYIRELLPRMKLTRKEQQRAELMCRESLMMLIEHSDFTRADYISVMVRKSFGDVNIILSVPGEEFDFYGLIDDDVHEEFSQHRNETANVLLKMFRPDLSYEHSGKFNAISVKAVKSSYSLLLKTLWALALSVITGLLLRMYLPEDYLTALNDNVLNVVYEIFLDAMKMCTIPVVLLSVMTCTSNIHGLSGLAKSGKILAGNFVFTQIFAVITGFGLVMLFGTGQGADMSEFHGGGAVSVPAFSVAEMLKNIIPDNVIQPLVNSNAIQLTVLGCILGIAAGLTASKKVLDIAGELSNIFMKITELFMSFVPVAVFCAVSSIIITTGLNVLVSVLGIFLAAVGGFILMNALYFVMVQSAGLNPVHMFRKSAKTMVTAFSTCSANAAIPDSLNACKSMGISPKLYSFAVPVGASLNKNAFCLSLAVITLTAANMYGIAFSWLQLATLGTMIIIIAPGTTWAPVIALSALFEYIGCPLSSIGVVLAIYPLLDMADTVTTCNGTIASTLTTARMCGLLDTGEYSRP